MSLVNFRKKLPNEWNTIRRSREKIGKKEKDRDTINVKKETDLVKIDTY